MNRRFRVFVPVVLLVALVAVAGCKKKQPPPPAATAPPATPAPTAQITATPSQISAGDQVTLSWRTTDATSTTIDGIGDVPTTGVKTVTPTSSTSYHLVARGDGGTADATAQVTVNPRPPFRLLRIRCRRRKNSGRMSRIFSSTTIPTTFATMRNRLCRMMLPTWQATPI